MPQWRPDGPGVMGGVGRSMGLSGASSLGRAGSPRVGAFRAWGRLCPSALEPLPSLAPLAVGPGGWELCPVGGWGTLARQWLNGGAVVMVQGVKVQGPGWPVGLGAGS